MSFKKVLGIVALTGLSFSVISAESSTSTASVKETKKEVKKGPISLSYGTEAQIASGKQSAKFTDISTNHNLNLSYKLDDNKKLSLYNELDINTEKSKLKYSQALLTYSVSNIMTEEANLVDASISTTLYFRPNNKDYKSKIRFAANFSKKLSEEISLGASTRLHKTLDALADKDNISFEQRFSAGYQISDKVSTGVLAIFSYGSNTSNFNWSEKAGQTYFPSIDWQVSDTIGLGYYAVISKGNAVGHNISASISIL